MNELRSELQSILTEAQVIARAAERALPHAAEVRDRLEDYQPVMMFYGCYNAGKSTVINALLGADIAPTSDGPCTTVVTEYKIGDYTVYDTPGIDAPVKHDQVSHEHLARCHAIAFVLSASGSFDEKQIIDEIVRIHQSGRPLVLVLNNKAGADLASGDLQAIQDKLLANCTKTSGDERFREHVPVVLVNAKTGVKARRENKPALYKMSGIADLENVLLRTLLGVKGETLLAVPAQLLRQDVDVLRADLESAGGNDAVQVLSYLRQSLCHIQDDFVGGSTLDTRELRSGLVSGLIAAAKAGGDLDPPLRQYLQQVSARVELRQSYARAALESLLQKSVANPDVALQITRAPGEIAPQRHPVPDLSPTPSGGLHIDPQRVGAAIQGATGQEVIKRSLLQLRQWKFPGIKGRWEKTLGTWAGKLAKGIGVLVQIGLVLWELRSAAKAQAEYEESMRCREQDLHSTAALMAVEAETDVLKQLQEVSEEAFGRLTKSYSDQLQQASSAQESGKAALRQCEQLSARLENVQAAIRAVAR